MSDKHERQDPEESPPRPARGRAAGFFGRRGESRRAWPRYVQSMLLVAVASLLGFPLHRVIAPTNLVMLYLAAVVASAVYLGRGPSILAAVVSVFVFDYFFVDPRFSFAVADSEYLLTFLGLLIVGLVISELAARARDRAQAALQREAQTSALYALSRDLASAADLEAMLRAVVAHVDETSGRAAIVLLPQGDRLAPRAQSRPVQFGADEQAVARTAFRQGTPSSSDAARYLPLKTARGTVGVLAVLAAAPRGAEDCLTPDECELLDAFASQVAVAIEREQLAEAARQAQVLESTEKLQAALLNSISHDLRTPLVSITGALSSLQEDGAHLDADTRRNLVDNARDEVDRLNRLVGNLLDMTRLEAGALRVTCEPSDVQDLIGTALEQVSARLAGRDVGVDAPDTLPLVPMDFVLMVQVLVNLLDNALKYSPPGSPLDVQAFLAAGEIEIDILDRGSGIPADDLARVFDKFYRVQRPGSVSGTGLGLSICKGIVEAHGGRIAARSRPGGGTAIAVVLPLAPAEGRPE